MKQYPSGTQLEHGDPGYLEIAMGNCPVCGKPFDDPNAMYTSGGHLHTILGDYHAKTIVFSACTEHYDEAQTIPVRHEHHDRQGYIGEWEPRFGLLAIVYCYSDESSCKRKTVRLI